MDKPLFRMTTKRRIVLDGIITTLNIRLESIDQDGYGRMLAESYPEEKRTARIKELDEELENLYLIHDVLETVACHKDEWNRIRFIKVDRGWEDEWDIPKEVFNEALNGMIGILKRFQKSAPEKNKDNYEKKIAFLQSLKDFRNA